MHCSTSAWSSSECVARRQSVGPSFRPCVYLVSPLLFVVNRRSKRTCQPHGGPPGLSISPSISGRASINNFSSVSRTDGKYSPSHSLSRLSSSPVAKSTSAHRRTHVIGLAPVRHRQKSRCIESTTSPLPTFSDDLPWLITSAKKVMFLPVFVCLSVCVYKITQKVMDGSF